ALYHHRVETLPPYPAQRRRRTVALAASKLGTAFELIDEAAAARRIRVDNQHFRTRLHAAPNRHADPRPARGRAAPRYRYPKRTPSRAPLSRSAQRQHAVEDAVAPDKTMRQRRSDMDRHQRVDGKLSGQMDRDRDLRQPWVLRQQRRDHEQAEKTDRMPGGCRVQQAG